MTGNPLSDAISKAKSQSARPGVSFLLPNGGIIELLYDKATEQTSFVVYQNGKVEYLKECVVQGRRYKPYSPDNNLIHNEVVLLPSKPVEYGSEKELVAAIQQYIHRYVDVSPAFEKLASYYVLFSWVYDAFNELPYLRARGDYGCGKTRFLVTAGAICYRPIFASGASTVSPLFRLLDSFRGTLVLDESDFRFSDEKAELIKILNNGNARGFPVLRSESNGAREFNPHAYAVYGPKLIASRGPFQDRALESRFLTEDMGARKLRNGVPINLPESQKLDALRLRNMLLLFRFRRRSAVNINPRLLNENIEPRLKQIFTPLLSIIVDKDVQDELLHLARSHHRDIVYDRGLAIEGQLLDTLRTLLDSDSKTLSVRSITDAFLERYGSEYERKPTSRYIGSLLRNRLNLRAEKSNGVYRLAPEELLKLPDLYSRYGIDCGSVEESAEASHWL